MNAILSLSKLKKIISKIALKHGVSAVWLFGSYARNEAKEHSDVDLLIEKGNVKTMIQLISFQQDLEKHLGIKVDVVTTESIKYDYFILKDTFATAVTFLSMVEESFIPISLTAVESTGVI